MPSLAVLGPTASGKSALAVAVARHIGGTVINGDPFQAYRGLAIGTGQPSEAEREGVPHVGYGVLDLREAVNPKSFGERVRSWIREAERPVLVTGSGLYLRGIWDQLSDLPPVPEAITERLRRLTDTLGPRVLHRYLAAVDPARAAALHPNDRSRVQRALALHLATGKRPSSLLDGVGQGVPEGWRAILALPGRERMRERVAARVRWMAREGWREEAEALRRDGLEGDLRRLHPLGYDLWLDNPRGALPRIIQETQAFAKRQETWFRNQWPGIPAWDPDADTLESALAILG
jgi:tRNA dimethylallyltransferase